MERSLRALLGAREPDVVTVAATARESGFVASMVLFIVGAAALVASIFFPYWELRLNAPQYPKGLFLTVFIDHIKGDISEIDGLNHYIGMRPLGAAAEIERTVAPVALAAIVLMVLALAFVHRKWFAPLAVPAMLLPLIFLADMFLWLRHYGQNLDPSAALSGAIKPFTPTILGHGTIGQFSTDARVLSGFWLATAASVLIMFGLHFRRAARRAAARSAAAA
ncbi:MAG: cytochrome C [Ardenticatenales bacterium]|nr:cytochrome C [Ardenticatenales bacterium]